MIKGNDDPHEYFPKVAEKYGRDVFSLQSIPFDDECLSYETYETFLQKRAELLAETINHFLDHLPHTVADKEPKDHTSRPLSSSNPEGLKGIMSEIIKKSATKRRRRM